MKYHTHKGAAKRYKSAPCMGVAFTKGADTHTHTHTTRYVLMGDWVRTRYTPAQIKRATSRRERRTARIQTHTHTHTLDREEGAGYVLTVTLENEIATLQNVSSMMRYEYVREGYSFDEDEQGENPMDALNYFEQD